MGYSLNDNILKKSFTTTIWKVGKTLFLVLSLALFSCSNSDDFEALAIESFPDRQRDFSMWQLAQFDFEVQMGYIIRTDDGKIIVVDGGMPIAAQKVTGYLNQLGGHVHTWVITHPHVDHIGVLDDVVARKEIQIDRILHSKVNDEWVFQHEPINAQLVSDHNQKMADSGIPVIDVKKGEVYPIGKGIDLKILAVKNESIIENAINNSSVVLKIESKSKSVLFLGDLGVVGGKKLLTEIDSKELQADYVQMAHHGQNGVDLNFYKAVKADYALWPTPEWLWENRAPNQGPGSGSYQISEVRSWTENELDIKQNHVAGLEGNLQID